MKKIINILGLFSVVFAMLFTFSSYILKDSMSEVKSNAEPIIKCSEKPCLARVHLKFKDGDEVYEGSCVAYFKGFLNMSKVKFTTDKHGYATIGWSSSQGEVINCIVVKPKLFFNDGYTKEGLNITNGGTYEICMDCK